MKVFNVLMVIFLVVCAAITAAYLVFNQRKKCIEWLKLACTEAEKELGTKTGQLKLRTVYNEFIQIFPVVAAVVPFWMFSGWVDIALETVRKWLDTNPKIAGYVKEDKNA